LPTTIEPSEPAFSAICRVRASIALRTISISTFWSRFLVLREIADDDLVQHVRSSIERRSLAPWKDELATGRVRPID
jgi:hypothetical protein